MFLVSAPIFSQNYVDSIINSIKISTNCDCINTNLYEKPYSLMENCPKEKMVRINLGVLFTGAIGAMGALYLMPESFTTWDKKSFTLKKLFGKYRDNVSSLPVFDKDVWFMNYVAHPYCGAIYYMDFRSVGYNALYSFMYSAGMSTILWEYGFEALAEIPSINDLIVTPVVGSILGEAFYIIKREIVQNGKQVLNSKLLGGTILFLIDPINEISHWLVPEKTGEQLNSTLILQPNYVGVAVVLQIR
jgi:hypothetical protein